MALAAALVLVNTGLLDFRRLAAADQVTRLQAGDVAPADFDVIYLRFSLGSYGTRALEALRTGELAAEHPVLVSRIDEAMEKKHRWGGITSMVLDDPTEIRERLEILPGSEPPEDLLLLLAAQNNMHQYCFTGGDACSIGHVDIDTERWWVVFRSAGNREWMNFSQLVRRNADDTRWLDAGTLGHAQCPGAWRNDTAPETLALTRETVLFLRIGNCAYQLQPLLEPGPLGPSPPTV